MTKVIFASALTLSLAAGIGAAHADEADAVAFGFVYKGDVAGVVSGGRAQAGRYLDNIELTADVSLERLLGWGGAQLYAHALSNSGGAPNDIAETLQGVDNIEVERPRAKLYQLWIAQEFAGGRGSVLVGLYDLNSEFYVTETAGDLIAPAFGIGSELAATGPNGPSIFPSTALSLRLRWSLGAHQQIQIAAVNAHAGVLGDPSGVDTEFDDGALLIGEWSYAGAATLRVGYWRYSEEQDDVRDTDGLGAPVQRTAHGGYVSLEGPLMGDAVHGFVRIGLADGHTTDFAGGWQAGVRVGPVFAARPDSVLAIGANQGVVSSGFRENQRDVGVDPARAESAIELTYSDRIHPYVTLQPDLQLIHNPGADRNRDDVVVATLRVIVEL